MCVTLPTQRHLTERRLKMRNSRDIDIDCRIELLEALVQCIAAEMPTEAKDRVVHAFQALCDARRARFAQQLEEVQKPYQVPHYAYEMRAAPPNPATLKQEIEQHDARLQDRLTALAGGPPGK